jgi:predicted permease
MMDGIWKDVRYAARVLAKSPGFTAVVVLSLALAIGANTAIFQLFDAFLLRPMPVDQPDRLVAMYATSPAVQAEGMSYPELLDLRKQDTGLSEILGFTGYPLSVTDGERPEVIWGEIVTGNYFSGLGIHPALGRGFRPEEDQAPGEKAVCVLGYNFWRRHFQSDPNIVGKQIQINKQEMTVVGAGPRGFVGARLFSFIPDVWVPVMMAHTLAPDEHDLTDLNGRKDRWMTPWGRLKPGVTRKQAEAAMNVAIRRIALEHPEDREVSYHLVPGGARTHAGLIASGLISATTAILGMTVILVLLIACSNVANLMLARAATRSREMAIRVAVGATRWRLVRQLITESVLLSLAGGVVGIVLSLWLYDRLKMFYPHLDFDTADLESYSRLDPRLFLFAITLSLIAAVIFGLVPALRASKVDQVSAMKGETGSVKTGRFRFGSGNLLVMAQVALSCVLLVVGGLFLRSMQFAENTNPGFDRTGITMFAVNLTSLGYDTERGVKFDGQVVERLRSIPGVESAAAAFALPLDAYDSSAPILPEGYVPASKSEDNSAGVTLISPHYFETMGTSIVAGRAIDERDTTDSRRVAVINETMARRYWKSPELAVGRRFRTSEKGKLIEVVGVARDGKYRSFGENATPFLFAPLTQDYSAQVEILVRSKQTEETLVPAIRQKMAELDPAVPIFGIRTMPQFLNRTMSIYEMGASLVGTFAVMAMLLAAVGIYGVLHFTVARRTREIGIRMALGARAGQVIQVVLRRSLAWVGAGLALGIGLALSARGLTQRLVAGVSGSDPLTFCAVVLAFAAIVTLAVVVPARRASRVDPILALRQD